MAGHAPALEKRRGGIVVAPDQARGLANRCVVELAETKWNLAFDIREHFATFLIGAEPARDLREAYLFEIAQELANESDIAARRASDGVAHPHDLLHQAAGQAD